MQNDDGLDISLILDCSFVVEGQQRWIESAIFNTNIPRFVDNQNIVSIFFPISNNAFHSDSCYGFRPHSTNMISWILP